MGSVEDEIGKSDAYERPSLCNNARSSGKKKELKVGLSTGEMKLFRVLEDQNGKLSPVCKTVAWQVTTELDHDESPSQGSLR